MIVVFIGKVSDKTNRANTLVELCCRPLKYEEETDEIFHKWLGEVSNLQTLVPACQMSIGKTTWQKGNCSMRFLKCGRYFLDIADKGAD